MNIRLGMIPLLSVGSAVVSLADAPILTGILRHSGQVHAFFLTPDRQTSFSLRPGSDWGDFHLVRVDFDNRLAVIEERNERFIARFGEGASTAPEILTTTASPPRQPMKLPFTPEEQLFRTQNGHAAFARRQQEQILERLANEGSSSPGAVQGVALPPHASRSGEGGSPPPQPQGFSPTSF